VPNKKAKSASIALGQEFINTKQIPIIRSSKLAAMAAHINTNLDVEQDGNTEISSDLEDAEILDDSALVKLEDILVVPNIIANRKDIDKTNEQDTRNKKINKKDDDNNTSIKNNEHNKNGKLKQDQTDANQASTSSSKDLSLSCINSSAMTDVNYRPESR